MTRTSVALRACSSRSARWTSQGPPAALVRRDDPERTCFVSNVAESRAVPNSDLGHCDSGAVRMLTQIIREARGDRACFAGSRRSCSEADGFSDAFVAFPGQERRPFVGRTGEFLNGDVRSSSRGDGS